MGLKGNELLIYASIYGFTQSEKQKYSGSLQYFADWTRSTKQGVIKNLKSLVEKGFIVKEESIINGVKLCSYYATELTTIKQSLTGYSTEFNGGIKLSLPNNKEYIQEDIKLRNTRDNKVPPTLDEVKAYCAERGNNINAEQFIDYYEARGWELTKGRKMVDWKAAVRTWERNQYNKQAVGRNGVKLTDDYDHDLDDILK